MKHNLVTLKKVSWFIADVIKEWKNHSDIEIDEFWKKATVVYWSDVADIEKELREENEKLREDYATQRNMKEPTIPVYRAFYWAGKSAKIDEILGATSSQEEGSGCGASNPKRQQP